MVLVGHIARKRRSQIAQCLACFAERIGHAPGRDADIVRHRVEQVRLITQTVVERVGPELPLKLHIRDSDLLVDIVLGLTSAPRIGGSFPGGLDRSEERSVGKEWGSTCRSRWETYH